MSKLQEVIENINQVREFGSDVIEQTFKKEMKLLNISEDHFLYRLGVELSQEPIFKTVDGPAYHNNYHAAEAMVSAMSLLNAEFDSEEKKKKWGPYLLVSMMAHDLEHPGRNNEKFAELEWHSYHVLEDMVFKAVSKWEVEGRKTNEFMVNHALDIFKEVIVGTEFSQLAKNNASQYSEEISDIHKIKVLANEADILASSLKETGLERGQLLAKEWKNDAVASFKGRAGFLKFATSFVSKGAKSLGVDKDVAIQIKALEELNPEFLDAMPRKEAEELLMKKIESFNYRPNFEVLEECRNNSTKNDNNNKLKC